jgi:tripartite-type tricarboxylate transporter receptor subunit TctC
MTNLARRAALAMLGLACLVPPALAQSTADGFPNRPIRIIVPYAAGGSSDVVARYTADLLRAHMRGQPVVVENRPSSNAVIGMQYVARAAPDGYTLLLGGASTNAVNPHLYRRRPYDGVGDYTSIGLVGAGPLVVSVNPELPVRTLPELIALAKARPGRLAFGSSVGVTLHLAGELLKTLAGIDMLHVPYASNTQALTDVIAGRLQVMFDPVSNSAPFIADGRLRAIVVPALHRAAALPDVPTSAEAGLPEFQVVTWFGLFGPAGMPAELVALLNAQLNAALSGRPATERLAALGLEPVPSNPAEAAAYLQADSDKWARVIRRVGIVVD